MDNFAFPMSFGTTKNLGPKKKKEMEEKQKATLVSSTEETLPVTVHEDLLPITHQLRLTEHSRPITGMSLDPSGARLVTGSRDAEVKFWDFGGMDMSARAFKTIEVYEGTPVKDVQFSLSGDRLLFATGTMHVKMYDRDGHDMMQYMKGDPYIRDLKKTKGHTGTVVCVRWHPADHESFITSSVDGTVRIWDVNQKQQVDVIPIKSKLPGGRTPIMSTAYSPDGSFIVASGQDGCLWVYNSKGPYLKPTHVLEGAHMSGSGASGLVVARDNRFIASRGLDDTVKLFDIRNLKKPLASQQGLVNFFEETNIVYSPDDSLILTGTSVKKDQGPGKVVMLDSTTLEIKKQVEIESGSISKVEWHPKINQLFCGASNGVVHVLYDPQVSIRGAMMCMAKGIKSKQVDDIDVGGHILNPGALPLFQDDLMVMDDIYEKKRLKRNELRKDPKASKKPEIPQLGGPGKVGKTNSSYTAYLMKNMLKDTTRDEDPREALLRHAKEAEENPYWVAPAYKKNQPKPIFADKVYEDEAEAEQEARKKRRA